ncbi:Diguanylate cyclase/phosphodiesterase [Novosphingobium resinovorum]|uniref:Diguanylate cyclase/phosphodiesterase n=1 Tax=Novosphingobium resinovorum TaxID=158500 RepID=A0A031K856_9SPHN|nr:tetratricopeptide repeat protein [Novosphingobium resinovorum]EZP84782.1 Diguanylate cyclase/phosphodiesterase [Novosphingobium resinovorum]
MNARIASSVLVSIFIAGTAHAEPVQQQPHLVAASFAPAARVTDTRFDAAAHVQQGYDLIRQGKQAQAVKLFDKVIADADQRLSGDLRPRLCRDGGAASGATVEVDPALCEAHFGKGFALIDLGRGDLAEAELRQASQMAPGNAHFANEYAELFKSRRDWQGSYDLFAKAWAVVDKSTTGKDARIAARALRGMGFTKAAMGQYDEAEKFYDQSLQYDPKSEIARVELSNISRRKLIGS